MNYQGSKMCGIFCLVRTDGAMIDIAGAISSLEKLKPRGPDRINYRHYRLDSGVEIYMGFTRLAIMDTTNNGLQPFEDEDTVVVCNGEIYNYQELAKAHDIKLHTHCDCEVILPLYKKSNGFTDMIRKLDAEFAMVLFNKKTGEIYAARDRFGVRPLFVGYNPTTRTWGFASEMKALHPIMQDIRQLNPQSYGTMRPPSQEFSEQPYYQIDTRSEPYDLDFIHKQIKRLLTSAVKKRLDADRPIGFLLSGGLDSSLIVAIACKILGPEHITCFTIGALGSPDVQAARCVTSSLGIRNHHIVEFHIEEGLATIPDVIRAIESYDITTIRASTPQYLLAAYIAKFTKVKVLLSGEGSDEIHGSYKYFRQAPYAREFHAESVRLLLDLCYFDNLRTDRTMAAWGLEVRVPFLDFAYVEFIMKLLPKHLMYKVDQIEKQVVRESFKGYLPESVLWRPKDAFSDAVSSDSQNWAQSTKDTAESKVTDEEMTSVEFTHCKPRTKDAMYFRKLFNEIYPGRDGIIPYMWLPRFQTTEILDPSARILHNGSAGASAGSPSR